MLHEEQASRFHGNTLYQNITNLSCPLPLNSPVHAGGGGAGAAALFSQQGTAGCESRESGLKAINLHSTLNSLRY